MTQQEKQLLIKDLCSRLPYGVMLRFEEITGDYNDRLRCIDLKNDDALYINGICVYDSSYETRTTIKPYLRDILDMTEEEKTYYDNLLGKNIYTTRYSACRLIDWLNEHYFDYNDLIEKGLALKASNEMYKIN